VSITQTSTAFVTLYPTEQWSLDPWQFAEAFAMYMGLPSPIIEECGVAGRRFRDVMGHWRQIDRHGTTLAAALLLPPGW
jgi:hypothetical protein